jgi:putative membrane protein
MNTETAVTLADTPAYLAGLPAFLGYFALSIVFAAVFMAIYSAVTPHHEFRLIRKGNTAAVPALLGALIGFALPMRAAMAGSINLIDFTVWAAIAAAAQIIAYFFARAAMPDVSTRITAGETNAGLWLGGVAVVVGLLNSAAMTY